MQDQIYQFYACMACDNAWKLLSMETKIYIHWIVIRTAVGSVKTEMWECLQMPCQHVFETV